jgi:hypothetical protein
VRRAWRLDDRPTSLLGSRLNLPLTDLDGVVWPFRSTTLSVLVWRKEKSSRPEQPNEFRWPLMVALESGCAKIL